jgi:hypothetical protein
MSEGRKGERVSLRELLEEMAEDDGIDLSSRERAKAEVKKLPKKAEVK